MSSSINLFVISTGQYNRFVPTFMESVFEMFFVGHPLHTWLFTDKMYDYSIPEGYFEENKQSQFTPVYTPKLPWPLPTLLRYHMFERIMPLINENSYIFYADVDTKFIKPVTKNILCGFTALKHFAYLSESPNLINREKFEHNTQSTAFVDEKWQATYHCGGFWGGYKPYVQRLVQDMIKMIDSDLSKHFIAKWHDESYFNRWLYDNPPILTLPTNFALQVGCNLGGNTILDYSGNVNFKDWRD